MANKRKLSFDLKVIKTVGISLFFLIPTLALIILYQERRDWLSYSQTAESRQNSLINRLAESEETLDKFKSEDQFRRNETLEAKIKAIEETFQKGLKSYENLLSLKEQTSKTDELDEQFAQVLALLSERNYASAAATLSQLDQAITKKKTELATKFIVPANVPEQSTPPASGYRRQKVNTDLGTFLVSIVTADLNSARVLVDTAAESTCHNDCPVLSLADYVSRNGAFAGVNGSYFCPASYPSCADKKNSFDTLLMNKNKVYFNSENNVYSTVPCAAFYGNTARFMAQSLEWGRDTGVDAVIANRPLLIHHGNLVFTGGGEAKEGARGGRSFIGATGSTVYIGVVHSATVAESAKVLHTLGIQNALNLDNGGSTALWSGGYKVGPGRNLANAVLLVRK